MVPIDGKLRSRLGPEKGAKLDWIARVRERAASEIGLDVGEAYTAYLDTGAAPVTTAVVAAHPLALIPYRWRFPVVGAVPYKGFFDPAEAAAERDRLRKEGWDADALPVEAFSTLGWFDDPVLSTMLDLPYGALADLIFHELTHRTIYIAGRSDVNEGLATVVARKAALDILEETFGPDSPELREYLDEEFREDLRQEIRDRLRADLDALYRSDLTREEKLERKRLFFAGAERTLAEAGIGGKMEPSNARILISAAYRDLVPLLREVMMVLGGRPRDLLAAMVEARGAVNPLARLPSLIAARKGIGETAGAGGP
jgi:predicted aminopeptidase